MKFKKSSIRVVKNCGKTTIGKREDNKSPNYYVKVLVEKDKVSSGRIFESLETRNQSMALLKAVKVYERIKIQGKTKYDKPIVAPDKRIDVYGHQVLEDFSKRQHSKVGIHKSSLEGNTEIRQLEGRLDNIVYPFFDNGKKDITTITYEDLDKFLNKYLPTENLGHRNRNTFRGYKTRKGYRYLITNIFKKAQIAKVIDSVPVIPELTGEQEKREWEPYTQEQICKIRDEFRKQGEFGKEMNDLINFLLFVPLRSGKEWIFLQNKHMSVQSHIKEGKVLVIEIPHRKINTKRQNIICKNIALRIYENRLKKRNPNPEDYIFFNQPENRKIQPQQLQKRINRYFKLVSKKLGFYRLTNEEGFEVTRPLYSLRPTQFIEDVSVPNADYEEIARNGNTSKEMIVHRYAKRYSKFKVSEIYDKLNKGRGSGSRSHTNHTLKKKVR